MSIASLITNGVGPGGSIAGIMLRGLTPGIGGQMVPTPIAVTMAMGSPTLLATPFQQYTIFINGVDRSNYVRIGVPVGPGITFQRQSGSRSIATFTTYEQSGIYAPQENDTVLIYESNQLVYRGIVDKAVSIRDTGSKHLVFTDVSCVDAGGLLDKRIFARKYDSLQGGGVAATVFTVVNELLTTVAADLNITLVYNPLIDTIIDTLIFNYIPATEVLNQLAQIINCEWAVDVNLNLYFYDKNNGFSTGAPASFLTNSKNWVQFKVTKSRALFANRVWVKSSRNIGATQTDTFNVPPWLWNFLLRNGVFYPELPVVKVNGVAKVVVWLQDFPNGIYGPGAPYFDFTFGGLVLSYNQQLGSLQPGDVVTVTYSSPLSSVAMAEDTGSIATDGLQEIVIEGGDIPSQQQLQDIADGALARAKVLTSEIELVTKSVGFDIRQLITVDIDVPPVNDVFIITSINSKEISKLYFEHTITAQTAQVQHAANMARYIGMLIARTRSPIDRIIERLDMIVAGTIEGFTNPGLAIGPKQGYETAQKDSLLGWISLRFKTIDDGTPTTSDIEIDVFVNGTSVFGSNPKIKLLAGKSVAQVWKFATDPYPIHKGDRITFEVISADSSAKDGALDIVCVG